MLVGVVVGVAVGVAVGVVVGLSVGVAVGLVEGAAVGSTVRTHVCPRAWSCMVQPATHMYAASHSHLQPATRNGSRTHMPPSFWSQPCMSQPGAEGFRAEIALGTEYHSNCVRWHL